MIILISVLSMGVLAVLIAVLLYFISRTFHVQEDPRKAEVNALLPGVNCGACGFPGCPGMAEALVKGADAGDISSLVCPPGGSATMQTIADYFGLKAGTILHQIAVLRCGGSCEASPSKTSYQGPRSCAVQHALYAGEGACPSGCVGQGDCVTVCEFDAMYMDEVTGLPVIDAEKCTACNACVKACPRTLIQLRPYARKGKRVWVNCRNTEKGAIAKKNCNVACIACGKCVKICDGIVQAITMENNLAYIDPVKCIACGKCVPECPTGSILATFPVKKAEKVSEETKA